MRSKIAAGSAVRMGYDNVWVMPWGWQGWQEYIHPGEAQSEPQGLLPGDVYPDVRLVLLQSKQDSAYLGLAPQAKRFRLSQIQSPYLLLILYNDLMPQRLGQTREYKELFHTIARDPALEKSLKIIGVGAGGLKRLVRKYARSKQIPFPLFSDSKMDVFHSLGDPELPILYLLKKEDQKHRIVLMADGRPESAGKLLELVQEGMAKVSQTNQRPDM